MIVNGVSKAGLSYPLAVVLITFLGVMAATVVETHGAAAKSPWHSWLSVVLYSIMSFAVFGLPMTVVAFLVFPRPQPAEDSSGSTDESQRRNSMFRSGGGGGIGILPQPDLRFGHEMLLSERPAFFVGFPEEDVPQINLDGLYWRADGICTYSHGRWMEDEDWGVVRSRYGGLLGNWAKVTPVEARTLKQQRLAPATGRSFDRIPGRYPLAAVRLSDEMPALEMNGEGGLRPLRAYPSQIDAFSGPVLQFWDMAQGAVARHPDARYTDTFGIPETLIDKAKDVAGNAGSSYEKIRLLRDFLFKTCRYSFRFASVKGDPVEEFVFRRKQGSCACFASALTLMLRSVDVPARLAIGYKGGIPYLDFKNVFVVRECDAHSWVEVYFDGLGWLPVEATPSTTAQAFVDNTVDLADSKPGMYDRLYSWWTKDIVGFTAKRQREGIKKAMVNVRVFAQSKWRSISENKWHAAAYALSAFGVVALLRLLFAFRSRGKAGAGQEAKGPFHKLLKALSRLGIKRRIGETPLEYAQSIVKLWSGMPDIGKAVRLFYAWRYGGHDTAGALEAEVNNLLARLPSIGYPISGGGERERSITDNGP